MLYAGISGCCRRQGMISKEKREDYFISSKFPSFGLRPTAGIEFKLKLPIRSLGLSWTEHQLEKKLQTKFDCKVRACNSL